MNRSQKTSLVASASHASRNFTVCGLPDLGAAKIYLNQLPMRHAGKAFKAGGGFADV